MIRILLVEDDLGDALLVREALAQASSSRFDLCHVERLDSAIESLHARSFDLVLMDLCLPDSMGLDTFVRLHAAYPHIPMIVLSHHDDENFAIEAMHAGAQDYLVKGHSEYPLVRVIRHAIERARGAAERATSELRLRTIIDIEPQCVVLRAADGTVLELNRAGLQILECDTLEQVREMGHGSFVTPPYHQAFKALHVRAIAGETGSLRYELVGRKGAVRWLEMHASPMPDASTGTICSLGIVRDLTAQRLAEQQLQAAHDQFRALARRLDKVREEQSTIIAREIHDVLAQELTRLKIDLVWIAHHIGDASAETLQAKLNARIADAVVQTDTAISTVQDIATRLRPVILDSLGLFAAVEWQVEDFARRTGLNCHVVVPQTGLLPDHERSTALFRILQESLTNIARHAEASEVHVRLALSSDALVLSVRDNGVGMDRRLADDGGPGKNRRLAADGTLAKNRRSGSGIHSMGLLGMGERALAFGGSVEFDCAPGAGTTVVARLPLEPAL